MILTIWRVPAWFEASQAGLGLVLACTCTTWDAFNDGAFNDEYAGVDATPPRFQRSESRHSRLQNRLGTCTEDHNMLKRTRMLFVRLARDRRRSRLLLHLFSAKFAPTSTIEESSPESGVVDAGGAVASLPDAPGIWQFTDEKGAQITIRVKDQNGELYANVGSLAVPVRSLSGRWEMA